MIQRLSHTSIFVLDQDIAHDFYVGKLGFEVRTDSTMDNGFRWLTVGPKGQPDLEIILMPARSSMSKPEIADLLEAAVSKGAMGAGVFITADCQKTYEELKGKGVVFTQEPTDRFYGLEAVFKDPFGNWFSLSQPK
jgi:catechol 2,3-dioxygenase-like lactoylglutathione lyase family enzyme